MRAQASNTIWITGAGRSGTNLVGMLMDGHPEADVFPYELRIVTTWLKASIWASQGGGQTLPGALLDHSLLAWRLHKARFAKMGVDSSRLALTEGQAFDFFGYIDRVRTVTFPEPKKTFVFRAPGSQLDFYLQKAKQSHVRNAQALLMLRHPVQNYLALISHDLQKGLGYQSQLHTRPRLGLHNFLHLSLLRVLRAFEAAKQFTADKRVTISKLETFSAEQEERQRVWRQLNIPLVEGLEELTRVGEPGLSSSGKWRTTQLQPVKADEYEPRLTRSEFEVFKKCEFLFEPYYPKALTDCKVFEGREADKLLYQREVDFLLADRNALDKRKDRIRSMYALPRSVSDLLAWPLRAGRILRDDVLFYPQARIKRMNDGYRNLLKGLAEIPEIYGILPRQSIETKSKRTQKNERTRA